MLKGARPKWTWIGIAAIGLALALGRNNPVYLLLAEMPGFNLFRVPARFLALYSLAMALLAGLGIQALLNSEPKRPSNADRRHANAIVLILGALIAVTALLLQPAQSLIFGGTALTRVSFVPWLLALLVLLIAFRWRRRWLTVLAAGCLLLSCCWRRTICPITTWRRRRSIWVSNSPSRSFWLIKKKRPYRAARFRSASASSIRAILPPCAPVTIAWAWPTPRSFTPWTRSRTS